MAFVPSTDLEYYCTSATVDGGAPSGAINRGGYRSNDTYVGATIGELFGNITGPEAASGDEFYACICLKNISSPEEIWYAVRTFINQLLSVEVPDSEIEIAYEKPTIGDATTGGVQTIADRLTAPASPALTYYTPETYAEAEGEVALDIDFEQNYLVYLWFKMTLAAGTDAINDAECQFTTQGDSAE